MAVGGVGSILSGSASSIGGGDVFSILGQRQTAGARIQSILDEAQVRQSRTQFFNNVALRIEALRIGQIQPVEDWEKVAAYLATTGQPYVVTVDKQGKVKVDQQSDTDLARYNEAEKRTLTAAFADVAELAKRIQANDKNQNWVGQLESVPPVLDAMRQWGLPPEPGWKTDAWVLAKSGIPFKVVLDDKGEISIIDQTRTNFLDAPLTQQPTLLGAIAVVRQTLKTGFSDGTPWSAQAQVYAEAGLDYFIDIDPITFGVLVRRNDSSTIVPDFLKQPPFADIGADKPWKRAAADLIAQGKGFYLDLDTSGAVIVRANDGRGINLLDQPRNATTRNPIVDLLA